LTNASTTAVAVNALATQNARDIPSIGARADVATVTSTASPSRPPAASR
jgi:hypothetical protein